MESKSQSISIQALAPVIRQSLAAGQPVELTVPGHSMQPTLLDRVSRVRLRPLTQPRRGDMVLYQRENGQYILHRIVGTAPDGSFVLCGDAQWQKERGIDRACILARVSDFTRGKGWISCRSLGYRLWWRFCLLLRPCRHIKASLFYRVRRLFGQA